MLANEVDDKSTVQVPACSLSCHERFEKKVEEHAEDIGTKDSSNISPGFSRWRWENAGFGCEVEPVRNRADKEFEERAAGCNCKPRLQERRTGPMKKLSQAREGSLHIIQNR